MPMSDGNSRNGRCGAAAIIGLKLCVARIPPKRTSAATEARREVIAAPVRDPDLLSVSEAIYGEAGSKQKPARRNPDQVPDALHRNPRSARRSNLARPSRPAGGGW